MPATISTTGVSAVKIRFAPGGPTGPAGRSVTGATVNGSGRLILTLSDATTIDAGSVIGIQGPQGVSVTSATVNGSGRLILTFSNGSTVDAGSVIGPTGATGVGIQSAVINGAGQIVLTYTDGSTANLGSVIGPTGATGRPAGLNYAWSTAIDASDPGSGKIKVNSASMAAVTALYISETDAGGVPLAALLATFDDSTSATRGALIVYDVAAPTNRVTYLISGAIADNGAWDTIPVVYVEHSGTLANNASVAVQWTYKGDKGDAGAAATVAVGTVSTLAPGASATVANGGTSAAAVLNFGIPAGVQGSVGPSPGISWNFSGTLTDADPGDGTFRINANPYSGATKLFIDNKEINGQDVTAWLDALDDSSNSPTRGRLNIVQADDHSKFVSFNVTGAVVDKTGYREVPVSYLAGNGSLTGRCAFTFGPAGQKGADGVGGNFYGSAATGLDGRLIVFDLDGYHGKDGGAKGALANLNTVNNSQWSGTALAIGNGGTGQTTASAARTALGLAIGTDVQAQNANLAAIAGLTTAADKMTYWTGAGAAAVADLTSFIRTLLDDANAAAARSTLGLGTLATASSVGPSDLTALANVLRGHLWGLTLSNTSGTSSASMDIAAGQASDIASPYSAMVLAAAITKTTSAWAVGSGNGGLDTGAIAANTWYYIWLIQRSDTGVVDALFSASYTAPTMPANYDRKRRIGAMKTNGSSQWPLFKQYGDLFILNARVKDLDSSSVGTSAAAVTLSVPPIAGIEALVEISGFHASLAVGFAVWSPDQADPASVSGTTAHTINAAVANVAGAGTKRVAVNGSGQVRYMANQASSTLRILTEGWVDTRGRAA